MKEGKFPKTLEGIQEKEERDEEEVLINIKDKDEWSGFISDMIEREYDAQSKELASKMDNLRAMMADYSEKRNNSQK